jgi:hypothetical protein
MIIIVTPKHKLNRKVTLKRNLFYCINFEFYYIFSKRAFSQTYMILRQNVVSFLWWQFSSFFTANNNLFFIFHLHCRQYSCHFHVYLMSFNFIIFLRILDIFQMAMVSGWILKKIWFMVSRWKSCEFFFIHFTSCLIIN